jgi:hypothetical protein
LPLIRELDRDRHHCGNGERDPNRHHCGKGERDPNRHHCGKGERDPNRHHSRNREREPVDEAEVASGDPRDGGDGVGIGEIFRVQGLAEFVPSTFQGRNSVPGGEHPP